MYKNMCIICKGMFDCNNPRRLTCSDSCRVTRKRQIQIKLWDERRRKKRCVVCNCFLAYNSKKYCDTHVKIIDGKLTEYGKETLKEKRKIKK